MGMSRSRRAFLSRSSSVALWPAALAAVGADPAGAAALAAVGADPAGAAAPRSSPQSPTRVAHGAADGELVYVGPTRDPVRIKVGATPQGAGRFAMIVQEMAPGSRVPIHLHEHEDEIIFIQRGGGRASVAGRDVALAPGSMLFVPQGTWHGGENTGRETLVWVAIYSPSGFEGYFREIGFRPDGTGPSPLTPDERAARDRRYGIRYPG